ncbi:MAG: hypothetical protein A2V45_07390 [Candidatus Aminicenantes bacterium RBG_19FT_COMBO_58_17]|nr:MAG: hypothetical protein A2V45_07390 [Candidatus Aminicenantes bacterium RBG_19FT_COMBO_58_17]
MNTMKKSLRIAVILSAFLALYSCNPIEDDSRSASMLLVDNVLGTDAEGKSGNYLQSDVVLSSGTIKADTATATLRAETLDPDPLLGTSPYNDLVVTRYLVSYTRTDGRNVPGVDVPYPFEGSMSTVVKAGSTASVSFIIVREVAKLEPPLLRLVDLGAEVVLACTAKVEFYGHDTTNRTVKATGYLTIYFANYADEEAQPPT